MKNNGKLSLNCYLMIIIIGNVLDHYDTSISSFLMPLISKFFFVSDSNVVSLIKGYSSIWGSLLGKSLGVIGFHFLVKKYGIKSSLIVSLIGMSVITFSIILIPHNIEYLSAILFITARIMQSFFAIGEYLVCSVLLIKLMDSRMNLASSYYHFSTMVGIILASFTSYLVMLYQNFWQYSFIFGSIVGVLGVLLRYTQLDLNLANISETTVIRADKNFMSEILANVKLIIKISLLVSLGYFTYAFSFIFINGLGSIADISYTKIMQYDYLWLIFDAILVFVFGRMFKRLSSGQLVSFILLSFIIIIPFIFYNLLSPTFTTITLVKMIIIILGVAYCIPLTSFTYNLCNDSNRYIILGTSTIIGNDLIGKSFTPIMLLISDRYSVILAMLYPLSIVIISIIFFKQEVTDNIKLKLFGIIPNKL